MDYEVGKRLDMILERVEFLVQTLIEEQKKNNKEQKK